MTLFSGPAPSQPRQRLPGPLPTLRLPGPAGGDAGRQQLQGSGPEGVGSFRFGPADPVGRGRNHGRCRSRGAPGARQGPSALLEAPARWRSQPDRRGGRHLGPCRGRAGRAGSDAPPSAILPRPSPQLSQSGLLLHRGQWRVSPGQWMGYWGGLGVVEPEPGPWGSSSGSEP